MINPLQSVDDQSRAHIEPSVTSTMTVQTQESAPPELPVDLYVLSTFRDPQPLTLIRTKSLAEAISAFDSEQSGDQGVDLIRVAKAGIADPNMFGAGDVVGVRVNAATASTSTISKSATALLTLTTAKYGNMTRRWRRKITAGTLASSRKIKLWNDFVSYQIDNLGPVMSIQYTGGGTAALLSLLRSTAVLTYTGQPADADKLSVATAHGVVVTFEFDTAVDPGSVGQGNVRVKVGGDANTTFGSWVTAIEANCPGVAAVQDTDLGTVTLTAPDDGVLLTEVTDGGNKMTETASGDPVALVVVVDGSVDLTIPLSSPFVNTIAKLVAFIKQQENYTASVLTGYVNNGFIGCSGLDVVSGTAIKAAAVNLTAYAPVVADAVNSFTGGYITATVLAAGEPDVDTETVWFSGGTTPAAVSGDWEDALDLIGAQTPPSTVGVVLLDTDDPAIFAMAQVWKTDQQALGKWFRIYSGAESGLTADEYAQIISGVNDPDMCMVIQRMLRIGADGTISTVAPIYLAAALAGGVAGNKPYKNPLTNKQLRFVGIAPDDDFDLVTREAFESSGITIAKTELGLGRLPIPIVAIHVTTSLSDKRMARIASENDTAKLIDATMRAAFLGYRGKWANEEIIRRAPGTMLAVLDRFRKDGAIVPGFDESGNAIPAYVLGTPAATIYQGVLKVTYTIYFAGELDHVAIRGDAEYTRLVASLTASGQVTLTTSIQL